MLWRCTFTVPSLHCNSPAIALFRSPRVTSNAISRSRAVRLVCGSPTRSIFLLCPKIMPPILSQYRGGGQQRFCSRVTTRGAWRPTLPSCRSKSETGFRAGSLGSLLPRPSRPTKASVCECTLTALLCRQLVLASHTRCKNKTQVAVWIRWSRGQLLAVGFTQHCRVAALGV